MAGARDREWPVEIAANYHRALTGSSEREWLVMPNATHSLLLERDRRSLYDAVVRFV